MTDTLNEFGSFPYEAEEVQEDSVTLEASQGDENLSEIDADSEPQTETNGEEVAKPNKLQERLDKLTAEKYEAKRRADELEAKLKALEANSKQAQLPDDLVAPELPEDTWDNEAMRKYHQDMIQYQRKLAEHAAKSTLSSTEQERKQAAIQQEQVKVVQGFAQRAMQNGISIEQLEAAGTGLVNAGLSQELQMLIMEDEAGPQITMHLAKNPELAYELLTMPTAKAAVKLATQVKQAAIANKPKLSKAPDPLPEGKPASIVERDDFEKKYKAQFI